MTAIAVSGLSKSFHGFHALKNVSFSVAVGERRAIIGPNGAGKPRCSTPSLAKPGQPVEA